MKNSLDSIYGKIALLNGINDVIFSGASFIVGLTLTSPVGLIASSAIIIGQGIYNGVSNVIEYRKKYHTTDSENWGIFWNTFLNQEMDDNIVELASRQDYIDYTAKFIWDFLNTNGHQNVFACGMGLGYHYLRDKIPLPDDAKIILNAENPIYSNTRTN